MIAPRLVKHMTLGIFAPASSADPTRFETGRTILEGLGFEVIVHPQTRAHTGYLAGADDVRAAAFFELLEDDRVDALMAARGGYGVHRLLDRFDADRIRSAQKPIVGFSDICALHAVCQNSGLVSFHGPVVTQLGDLDTSDHAALASALTGTWAQTLVADGATIHGGVAEGPLIGGCLSVLTPLIGTPYAPPIDGAILLLEDVGEPPYRIDRQLTHLRLAGWLDRIAAIGIGDFVNCRSPREGEATIEEVLDERLHNLGIPVVTQLPFGHGTRNRVMPLGGNARLDADAKTLVIAERPA